MSDSSGYRRECITTSAGKLITDVVGQKLKHCLSVKTITFPKPKLSGRRLLLVSHKMRRGEKKKRGKK